MSARLFTRFKATLTLKEKTFCAQGYFNVRSLQDLAIYPQFIPQMADK